MNKFRYSSYNLHSLLSHHRPAFHAPPKTLVSLEPPPINFPDSVQFHTNSSCNSRIPSVSSPGPPSDSVPVSPFSQKFRSLHMCRGVYIDKGLLVNSNLLKYQCYGTTGSIELRGSRNAGVKRLRQKPTREQVQDIIRMIRRRDTNLESMLQSMDARIPLNMCSRIFNVLNREKIYAMGLCDWIRFSDNSCRNDVRSMVIDNLGRLGDYEAMSRILSKFTEIGVCLTPLAFQFVSILPSKEDITRKVVEVLNKVEGTVRGSGLCSLVKMFSVMGSYEMAEFVMQLSGKKVNLYNIMIIEKCRVGDFDGAKNLLGLMKQCGLEPEAKTLNYILSSLCNHDQSAEATVLVEEMLEKKCTLDAVTIEIFVCYLCKKGKFDLVIQLLDRMTVQGIKPRLSTHDVILKAYFVSKRYKEAYQYVIESGVRYNCPHLLYTTLARLYVKDDKVIFAHKLLSEMMTKGLIPNYPVYKNVIRQLTNTGRSDLAEELKSGFSVIAEESTTGAE